MARSHRTTSYFNRFGEAFRRENAEECAKMLRFDDHFGAARDEVLSSVGEAGHPRAGSFRVPAPLDQVLVFHFQATLHKDHQEYQKAYTQQQAASEKFMTFVDVNKADGWYFPILKVVLTQLRVLSIKSDKADEVQHRSGKGTGKARQNAVAVVQKFFRAMVQTAEPQGQLKSCKVGVLFILVTMFKIYFDLNNLKLCETLIKSVSNANFPSLELFPYSQSVAYLYYLGRIQLFNEKYIKAEDTLSNAFRGCYREAYQNKRKILNFLIPVRLLLGQYPENELLKKYDKGIFVGLVHAIRTGSLEGFNSELEKYQDIFIQKGIYLVLEKLKTYVYRNLFRSVLTVWQTHVRETYNEADQAKFYKQLRLSDLQTALKLHGTQMDQDELECILANLIFDGYIKGYIAHGRCVVVSKQTPFPDLRIVIKNCY